VDAHDGAGLTDRHAVVQRGWTVGGRPGARPRSVSIKGKGWLVEID
jgi:hypothetical protein